MRSSPIEVLTGAGVLALAAGFLFYAVSVTAGRSTGDTYPLIASFRSIEGVKVGSEVRMAGVKIGHIDALDLNPTTFRADATVMIDKTITLPDDSAILISSEGLLGGNYVEVRPGGSPFDLEEGDAFTDTQGAVSLINLLVKFVAGSGE